MNISSFSTPQFFGYNVKFSPHVPNVLACCASQNYGISGKGALFILHKKADGIIEVTNQFDWSDGIFDVAWSELDQNVLVTGCGDGSIQIWNIAVTSDVPVMILSNHHKEVYGVDFSQDACDNLLSASWDKTVNLWDLASGIVIATYAGHDSIVYSAIWSPHLKHCFASVSGDRTLKLWDSRSPLASIAIARAHETDVLHCDWCKYENNILVTCGADGLIKGWDIRNSFHEPIFQLVGHEYAVRRVKFSPFYRNVLASVSYDFTTRIWEWELPNPVKTYELHTEFVYGLDYSLHTPGMLADCGWDSVIHVFEVGDS